MGLEKKIKETAERYYPAGNPVSGPCRVAFGFGYRMAHKSMIGKARALLLGSNWTPIEEHGENCRVIDVEKFLKAMEE